MTLGELEPGGNLVGLVFRAHEKSDFAYRGIVRRTERRSDEVYLFLREYARRYEGGKQRRGTWKPLPDGKIVCNKDLSVRFVGKIITFTLADGGRGYLYPTGTKLEEVENAPRS